MSRTETTTARSYSGQSGMSLPEVLAAMVVLSLGVLGLAPMMAISIDGSTHAEDVTAIVASVQEKLEARIAAGITGPVPITEVNTYGGGKYTVTTRITDKTVDAAVPDHVYKIDVSAQWQDDVGVDRSMGFVTYAGKT